MRWCVQRLIGRHDISLTLAGNVSGVKLNELVMFFSARREVSRCSESLGVVAGPVVFAIAGSLLHTFTHLKSARGESEQTYNSRLDRTP